MTDIEIAAEIAEESAISHDTSVKLSCGS